MARKTATKAQTKPAGKTVMEDNYVAPKRKPKTEKAVTLAEALAESGETIEELTATPAAGERPVRPVGNSNLATTIRDRRRGYTVALHPNGKKTQNNGDQIATLLLLIPLPKLQEFSAMRFDGKTYSHLNPGHARMCIGNLIRAAAKKDESVLSWLYANQPKTAETAE